MLQSDLEGSLGLLFVGSGRYLVVCEGGEQLTLEQKVAVGEIYLKGLVGKDISKVPFATDVTFEGPGVPPLAGREVVVGFLQMILPAI